MNAEGTLLYEIKSPVSSSTVKEAVRSSKNSGSEDKPTIGYTDSKIEEGK